MKYSRALFVDSHKTRFAAILCTTFGLDVVALMTTFIVAQWVDCPLQSWGRNQILA
jgi:hypothetical protein